MRYYFKIIKRLGLFETILNDYNSVMNTFSIKNNNELQALWKRNENGLNNQTVSQTL